MKRFALILLILLLLSPGAVYGQQRASRDWHFRGRFQAVRNMQQIMFLYIAKRDGVRAAEALLNAARKSFGVQWFFERAERERPGIYRDTLRKWAEQFQEGGLKYFDSLESTLKDVRK